MTSTELAIRDVDAGKFELLTEDFWIADSAWWAIRVLDWNYSEKYGDIDAREPGGKFRRVEACYKSMVHAKDSAAFELNYAARDVVHRAEAGEKISAHDLETVDRAGGEIAMKFWSLVDSTVPAGMDPDLSLDQAGQDVMEAMNRAVAAGYVVEATEHGAIRIFPMAYPEQTALYLWQTAHGDWEMDPE